ncbi:3-carboxyethylcatechol 2,3-dioxygenase [Micromonospora sonneratiae]|uniref:2,3-dihydroxyphenylpropionate/2,3-dihydroxicinnamic acid 1,2-dioxygenase n=1 Tax=Micromonospora sonneratiae TaxID=1184706 RepID=A0ABW3YHD1_9ACTN
MTFALVCMSHSPLLEFSEAPQEVLDEVHGAFGAARDFVTEFDPDLIVSFAPDHYNGFFYELMPQFCIGYEATSVGDYDSETGPLDVPAELAQGLAVSVIEAGLDCAISLKMEVDHGAVQPLELLFGGIARKPVIPIFVNSVAPPFAPMRRIRLFGRAVGDYLRSLDARVLVIGSGGLSHDPPVPQIATATEDQRKLLLNGRHPTAQARAARQQRVIDEARAFARGESAIMDLNPEWDRNLMAILASGELDQLDGWTAAQMAAEAGKSSHEVRTWVAAHNAMQAAVGEYEATYSYYRPIRELITGFGVTTVVPKR